MCVRRRDLQSIASKVSISFGAVQSILTDILGMSKMFVANVDRRSEKDISRYLLSLL